MNDGYARWGDVRARGHAADPRTPAEQAEARRRPGNGMRPISAATSWPRCARRRRSRGGTRGGPRRILGPRVKIEHGENSASRSCAPTSARPVRRARRAGSTCRRACRRGRPRGCSAGSHRGDAAVHDEDLWQGAVSGWLPQPSGRCQPVLTRAVAPPPDGCGRGTPRRRS